MFGQGVDWEFNAWADCHTAATAHGIKTIWSLKKFWKLRISRYKCPLITEGGAYTTDGEGTVIVTEESIICNGRNPGLEKSEAEEFLTKYLNVSKVIWLEKGIILTNLAVCGRAGR